MNITSVAQVLGNAGEFVGAIAVVVTLIYLAAQVRQNATQIKLNSAQIATERYANMIAGILRAPDRMRMFRDGLESFSTLSAERQAQFHSHLLEAIDVYENSQRLADAGVLSAETVQEQKRDLARIFKCEGAREWRASIVLEPRNRSWLDALVDDVLADRDAIPLTEQLPFMRRGDVHPG